MAIRLLVPVLLVAVLAVVPGGVLAEETSKDPASGSLPDPGRSGSAGEEPAPRTGSGKASKAAGKKTSKKASKAEPKEKPAKPPLEVALPAAGQYPALEILALAGVLTGRTVRTEGVRVQETRVEIPEGLGRRKVTLEELTVLLAAHRLFLFPLDDPKEGKILAVSRDPQFRNEPPRFLRIIEVLGPDFKKTAALVEKAVEERNARLPRGAEPMVMALAERAGKILLRSPREEDVDAVEKAVGKEKGKDPDRPRLYTYVGKHRKVEDLEEDLLEKLSEGEANRIRIVIASRGNRLLLRCPESLWERVSRLLEKLDKSGLPDKIGPKKEPGVEPQEDPGEAGPGEEGPAEGTEGTPATHPSTKARSGK